MEREVKERALEFPGGLVVKDPALLVLWLRSNPRPWKFRMQGPKKKSKKRKRALIEKQLKTVLSKKGLQSRKVSFTKAKRHGQCHTRTMCPVPH